MQANTTSLIYASIFSFGCIFLAEGAVTFTVWLVLGILEFLLYIFFSHKAVVRELEKNWLNEDYDNHSRVANIMIARYYFGDK